MEHQTTKKAFIILCVLIGFSLSSCYYDKKDVLYPEGANCTTENVSFSQTVWPILNNNCVSCHSGPNASGGITMGNYNELIVAVNGGRFIGSIKHEAGFSSMPKNAPKLNDCNINQIDAWIAQGMLNN